MDTVLPQEQQSVKHTKNCKATPPSQKPWKELVGDARRKRPRAESSNHSARLFHGFLLGLCDRFLPRLSTDTIGKQVRQFGNVPGHHKGQRASDFRADRIDDAESKTEHRS